MPLLSEQKMAAIEAAFAEAGHTKGVHGDCVDSCRERYTECMAAGHSYCRDALETCINGCPDGMAPERLKALLSRLAEIEAS